MTVADTLLPEFDQEMATTRRVLERVPGDKGKWKPHPKSFPLGHLAQLVSGMPGWITNAVTQTSLDLGGFPGYSYEKTENRERLRFPDSMVAEAGRSGLLHGAARRHRPPDDQSSRSPSRSAHSLSSTDRCPGSVHLRTVG